MAGDEGDDRGWDGWMASLTLRTWVWASSGRWWWTGSPGVLQSIGSQRVGHDWVIELNWLSHSKFLCEVFQWIHVALFLLWTLVIFSLQTWSFPGESETGPHAWRAGRNGRRGSPLQIFAPPGYKQGNFFTKLVLVAKKWFSHPPVKILKVYMAA